LVLSFFTTTLSRIVATGAVLISPSKLSCYSQFLGAGFGLFLSDGCQLGFLLFQLIVQTIVAFFEFFDGDSTGRKCWTHR